MSENCLKNFENNSANNFVNFIMKKYNDQKKDSVSIHQPDFIPYFGFFNKISKSETFVIMDNVQLSKSGWTHRDQIKTKKGVEWITIPIKKIKEKQLIKDVKIDEQKNWNRNI